MVAVKQFAPDYPRTPENLIRFPPDKPLREQLFTTESMGHPAKANLWMVQAIYQYVATPGEVLLDITSGVGSLMMACLEGYQVVLIELNEHFHKMQLDNARHMSVEPCMLLGDCREYLPFDCDHVIFSPPYSNTFHKDGMTKKAEEKFSAWVGERNWQGYAGHEQYVADDPRNLGLLNPFLFGQALEKIYGLCFMGIRPGGTMTIIIQDLIKGGQVHELGYLAQKQCERIGFVLDSWHKRPTPGSPKKSLHKQAGHRVVESEDIIILRKPGG